MTLLPDAEKFAEEWRAHCASLDLDPRSADNWLAVFRTMYLKSCDYAPAVKHFDQQLEIIRMDLPFIDRLNRLIANPFQGPQRVSRPERA
jgi:hypothetical protein